MSIIWKPFGVTTPSCDFLCACDPDKRTQKDKEMRMLFLASLMNLECLANSGSKQWLQIVASNSGSKQWLQIVAPNSGFK